jgi:sec-independent protein translocase protein TatB
MIVLFLVVLVVFGPQKLPELARGLGKLMAEFRKASTDFKSAFEEEMREMERQAMQAERKKAAAAAAAAETIPPALTEGAAVTAESAAEVKSEPAGTQEPVVATVAESVPRSPEGWTETKTEAAPVNESQDTLHDHQHPV